MFRNHLQVALRNMAKRKSLAFINICGLGISIGAFLLIVDFISFQQSFDDFHSKADRIYRIQYEKVGADYHDKSVGLAAGAGPDLKAEYPEIESFSKIWATKHLVNLLTVGSESFISEDLFYADENFFNLFDFEFLYGDRVAALSEPNSIVLTESMAMRMFNKTDVVGEVFRLSNGMQDEESKVTGVIGDLPANTHFNFDVLVSFSTLISVTEGNAANTYGWNAFPTYLLLAESTDAKALEAKFPHFVENHYQNVIEAGIEPSLYLRPLRDIYLHSNIRFEVGPTGSYQVVQILIVVSIFILGLAYFNYINLTTSLALQRAKEIGVRKVTGATRPQLFLQFMVESLLFNILSLLVGFTLMQSTKPFFQDIMGIGTEVAILQANFLITMALILVVGTLVSGLYPAWIMSRLELAEILKGKSNDSGKTGALRKGLMVFQFVILCFLLVGSLAVRSQIDYMVHVDWGFDSEQVLVVKGPVAGNNTYERFQSFVDRLNAIPGVEDVAQSTNVPGQENTWINNGVRRAETDETHNRAIHFLAITPGFFSVLDVNHQAGRNFRTTSNIDSASVILSEAALKDLGFASPEEAIGKRLIGINSGLTVVGVVGDYIQNSFKQSYQPTAYLYGDYANNYFILKVNSDSFAGVVKQVEDIYQEAFAGNPFDYFFLDDFYQNQFEEERRFAKVFNLFTILGIWISCLGLIGLTSLSVAQRTKEIGIRKVLGASLFSVVTLFSRKMIWLNLIAVFISIPLAYFVVNAWLDNYVFATRLSFYIYAIPVAMLMAITFITTGLLSIRGGLKNPVNSLRYE
ncbi:MAG: ABC transporter permease [Cytophagia bacterium]|nr:ABC transporter permease [Cytophagia bacterium]